MRRRRESGALSEGGHDGGGTLRWLLTYSDMITLLMAFFIMLYSMSILNLNRFRQVAVSIRSGFGGLVQGQGRSPLAASGQFSIKPSPIAGDTVGVPWQAVSELQQVVSKSRLEKVVKLRQDERGFVVSLVTDKALFAKGQADLSSGSKKILDAIAGLLKKVPNQVRVEGHTCNLPVASERYPSNWELSTARATNVVRYFIEEKGIPADRLSVAGYADSKPLVPNTSESNRALNRRVDVVVLRSDYQ